MWKILYIIRIILKCNKVIVKKKKRKEMKRQKGYSKKKKVENMNLYIKSVNKEVDSLGNHTYNSNQTSLTLHHNFLLSNHQNYKS